VKAAVIVFPGSNCDRDCAHAFEVSVEAETTMVFHKEERLPPITDLVVLPGGFAHGDYLRPGAIAEFSPIMEAVKGFAKAGGLVIGICNGFQILTECGLLPGALLPNRSLSYICRDVTLRVESAKNRFTHGIPVGTLLEMPIGHGGGAYYADAETLDNLERKRQVILRYADDSGGVMDSANPNGSVQNIAGIVNEAGNVCGMMPHPDRSAEELLSSKADGARIFRAIAGLEASDD